MTKLQLVALFVTLSVTLFTLATTALARDAVDDMIAINANAYQASAASARPLSAAGIKFEPTIADADFQYFQAKGDDAEQQVGYFTLAIVDGEVTVQLSDSPSPGSLTHTFDAIGPRPTNGEWRRLYGPARLNEVEAQEDDQAKVLANLRELAGMRALGNGWAVTHDDLSLDDAVAAYGAWFDRAGGEMSLDSTTANGNVRPYDVSGLANQLRVVFHREGSGVRVYIGNR